MFAALIILIGVALWGLDGLILTVAADPNAKRVRETVSVIAAIGLLFMLVGMQSITLATL